MTSVIPAKTLTLRDLEQRFQLRSATDPSFFQEWYQELPSLTAQEKQWLDRVKANYLNLTKSHPILEDLTKMVVVSPLLDLAGFYQEPFEVETEFAVQITVPDRETLVQGRIDVLVLQGLFGVLVIESKNSGLSLEPGIPQALTYMLDHPHLHYPVFGLISNGSNFLFLKVRSEPTQYALSDEFSLRRGQDLYTGQCEVFQKISFLYELKPLQALTYTTCKPGPDENHSQTLKPLSDGHSLKNFALSSYIPYSKFLSGWRQK